MTNPTNGFYSGGEPLGEGFGGAVNGLQRGDGGQEMMSMQVGGKDGEGGGGGGGGWGGGRGGLNCV